MVRTAFLMFFMLITACKPAIDPQPKVARAVVCATAFPLADIAREIGGDQVRADWILNLGDPITGYALSAEDRDRMTGIDLLLCGGIRTEGWAQAPITSLQETGRVISLDQTEIAHTAPPTGLLWLDPIVVRAILPVIEGKLISQLPQQANLIRQQTTDFTSRINRMIEQYPRSAFGNQRVMVTENTFDALLNRFGIASVMVETPVLALDDEALQRIRKRARDENVMALLLPFDTPGGTVQDIENRTGLRVYLIDHLGLPQYDGHATWMEILDFNLKQLQNATRDTSPRNAQK